MDGLDLGPDSTRGRPQYSPVSLGRKSGRLRSRTAKQCKKPRDKARHGHYSSRITIQALMMGLFQEMSFQKLWNCSIKPGRLQASLSRDPFDPEQENPAGGDLCNSRNEKVCSFARRERL